jgi:hypothetical protein
MEQAMSDTTGPARALIHYAGPIAEAERNFERLPEYDKAVYRREIEASIRRRTHDV